MRENNVVPLRQVHDALSINSPVFEVSVAKRILFLIFNLQLRPDHVT